MTKRHLKQVRNEIRGNSLTANLTSRIRSSLPLLLLLFGSALSFLLLVVFVSLRTGIPIYVFTADPLQTLDGNPFTGVVSNIGILIWCASASVCFFSFAILRNKEADGGFSTFFLFSGLLTCMLLFDDFFQFHEYLFPRFLNIDEKVTAGVYGVLTLLYLARFRKIIRTTEFVPLLLSLGFFGASVIIDRFPHNGSKWHFLYEDGTKLLGIVGWFGYYAGTSFRAVREWAHQVIPDLSPCIEKEIGMRPPVGIVRYLQYLRHHRSASL